MLGAYGVWISMPIADSASVLLAFSFFVWQMRKMRREELRMQR
jgi:Na+-driven multidrug efflux pump